MKHFKRFIIVLFFIMIPLINGWAATEPYNAGFVSGLWYSKVPFFAGETIRIYTAFQNYSGGDITGTVEFFDNEISIGKNTFSATNNRLVETWIDWTVPYGNHTISAKIIDTKRSEVGKPSEEIKVLVEEFQSKKIFSDNPAPPPPIDLPTQNIVNKLSTIAENITTTLDNYVGYDAPTTSPATPVTSQTITAPKENNPTFSSATKNILPAINNYVGAFLQTVNTQRQEIKSKINNIDDLYKRIDTNHDGLIGLVDFNTLMVNWNKRNDNVADYNQDKMVDILDFNILMIYWS